MYVFDLMRVGHPDGYPFSHRALQDPSFTQSSNPGPLPFMPTCDTSCLPWWHCKQANVD